MFYVAPELHVAYLLSSSIRLLCCFCSKDDNDDDAAAADDDDDDYDYGYDNDEDYYDYDNDNDYAMDNAGYRCAKHERAMDKRTNSQKKGTRTLSK